MISERTVRISFYVSTLRHGPFLRLKPFEGQKVKEPRRPFVKSFQTEVMKNGYYNAPSKLLVITLNGKTTGEGKNININI